MVGTGQTDDAVQLRAAGLRVTAPRLAVLSVLRRMPHANAEAVAKAARKRLASVSDQAIYDILNALTTAGLVRRIEPAGSRALYEARVADNHHHIVCRRCTAVADVDCLRSARPCLSPADAHGFAIDEAEVTFWGVCPSCQRKLESRHER